MPLPGQVRIQLLLSGGGRRTGSSVIYHLGSLIWPIEVRDLRPVVAVDHKRRRDNLWGGRMQQPQQKQAVQGHRAERSYGIATDTGLRSRKHSDDTKSHSIRR